ncbi:MAG TPA: rRNA pseudouridine synthase [Rhodospirillaceae bacterium]|nr:rRNA pseudouridine synthase [Rhodospirillaceae bacterium]
MSDKAPERNAPERIAKVIARAGLCSRREAERWIEAGRVQVDGKKLTTPAHTVTAASHILVDGKPLPGKEKARLWRYHKPVGLMTTHKDPEGRPTVFDRLPRELPRVVSVGRLDLNSEGLLLLTNDGELARRLELPSNGWNRRYRVRVHGQVTPEDLAKLAKGVTVSGVRYAPIRAQIDETAKDGTARKGGANTWLTVALTEGKNREIRKVMEYLGLSVNRLIRTSYGPFQLGNLGRGEVDEIKGKVLKEQLGTSQ